jgi:hypothetical protein
VKRADYLAEVIRLYLLAPDTPHKASRRDWSIADTLYRRGISFQTVGHAIRLATLRRHLRNRQLGPLEPIHSLAYYRAVIERMDLLALDPGYIEYIAWKYNDYFGQQTERKSQNTAFLEDR